MFKNISKLKSYILLYENNILKYYNLLIFYIIIYDIICRKTLYNSQNVFFDKFIHNESLNDSIIKFLKLYLLF